MAKRYVTKTGKDRDGDITRLCNAGDWWSPRSKADAIRDIESGAQEYWVNWANSPETKIHVEAGRPANICALIATRPRATISMTSRTADRD